MQEGSKLERPLGVYGLGGWLIVVQIGLWGSVLSGLVLLFVNIIPSYSPDVWNTLTMPGSDMYHQLWKPLIVFETIFCIASLAFIAVLLVCFYRRKAVTPRLFIILYAVNLVVTIIDTALVVTIQNAIGLVSQGNLYADVIRNALTCAIWIPYFLKSERVANTFVR
ncbi:DUF2569 domain-containing protein [Paenibacillus sp. PL2-23]|uniref:DUF2569 domain-containing protein n=1 Tax=Paenibacillus sp. PL2-23 TaxID=2100729 RepID=UPI0030F634B7